MPTTSVYGFRYQALSDAPDGAALGKNLAEDVEGALQGNLTLGGNLTIPGTLTVGGINLTSPPRCQVRQTTLQTVGASAFTPVTFTTEDIDSVNGHDTAVNPSRYTCQVAGRYLLSGKVGWAGNSGGIRASAWHKNGTVINGSQVGVIATASGSTQHVAATMSVVLAVSDYIELHAFQDSAGNLDTSVAFAGLQSFMHVLWIAST